MELAPPQRLENSMPRVVIVLKRVVPGEMLKKAAKIMWEALRNGQAEVKSCHMELAELYMARLQGENVTESIDPAGSRRTLHKSPGRPVSRILLYPAIHLRGIPGLP